MAMEQFEKEIRILKIYAVAQIAFLIVVIILLGLAAETAIAGEFRSALSFLFGAVGCILVGSLGGKSIHSQLKAAQPWEFLIGAETTSEVIEQLNGQEMIPNGYVAFGTMGKRKARVLIQHCDCFDSCQLSKQRKQLNRKVNKIYQIPSSASSCDMALRLRVNLVICEKTTPELTTWVNRDAVSMVTRAESIINAAVTMDEKILRFPPCTHGLSWKDVCRYEAAVKLLYSRLASRKS